MKPSTTRTLNPLPFQDLEPHRFEDLVRQLAYDFRQWKRIEPTGKGGADDGMDIRAIELIVEESETEEEVGEESVVVPAGERLWIFQCKREKAIGPKALREIVAASLPASQPMPHGFVLAAACDFSKQAHDAFREEMVARKIGEFYLWGRSTLEDMLFQPKNDPLLFVYFGLSLQPRRRSMRTQIRSIITIKKQLNALFKKEERHGKQLVLLRDANDETYVTGDSKSTADQKRPRWILCEYLDLDDPAGFAVLRHEYLARISPDRAHWDAILEHDFAPGDAQDWLRGLKHLGGSDERDPRADLARDFWEEYVASQDRAYLKIGRIVPFERILAIDPSGDRHYPIPHLLVEFSPEHGPFDPDLEYCWMEGLHGPLSFGPTTLRPDEGARERFFPDPIPSQLFPPPEGLDHPLSKAADLPVETAGVLQELLAQTKPKASGEAEAGSGHRDHHEKVRHRIDRFRTWRDKTAIPVFSAFVQRLVADGHQARVAVRSVSTESDTTSLSETVELRVRVKGNIPWNPRYHREARLAYFVGAHTGDDRVGMEQEPKPEEPDRSDWRHQHAPPKAPLSLDLLTEKRVQDDVLALLKCLIAELAR